jgi:hypothetical protein
LKNEKINVMPQIQSIADPDFVKYLASGVGFLIGLVNFLGFYILKGIKRSIDGLVKKQNADHDTLKRIEAEHNIYHGRT